MSTLAVTNIKTGNGTTSLILTSGNTLGPDIVVSSNSTAGIVLQVNSTVNAVTINTMSTAVTGSLTVSSDATVSGSLVVSGTANVTGNVTSAGNINSVAGYISSNTLNLGTSSIVANGYSRLPNGLLIQWGSGGSANTSTAAQTFPIAFSTLYAVTVSGASSTGTNLVGVTASNSTTFTPRSASVSSPGQSYTFMAIGS